MAARRMPAHRRGRAARGRAAPQNMGSGERPPGVCGTVDASNSLVGSNFYDHVGSGPHGYDGVTPLSNGNYVVGSPDWNGYRGAATWGSGTAGISGTIDASNSLVGSNADDQVGYHGVTALSNSNYVDATPHSNRCLLAGLRAPWTSSITARLNGYIRPTSS